MYGFACLHCTNNVDRTVNCSNHFASPKTKADEVFLNGKLEMIAIK